MYGVTGLVDCETVDAACAQPSFSGRMGIVIKIKQPSSTSSASAEPVSAYLNGYRSAINGLTIQYHSSDPDVDAALIVRGQSMAHSVFLGNRSCPKRIGRLLPVRE